MTLTLSGHFEAQLLVDFDGEMLRPPPGWKYCPCGKLVSLAAEPIYAEDAAGVFRPWHPACRVSERDEQKAKRERARLISRKRD